MVDVDAFRRDGITIVRRALGSQRMRWYQDVWAAFERTFNGNRQFEGGKTQIWTFPESLDGLCREPALVDIAIALLGPDVCVYQRRLLLKDEAFRGAVEPHQDAAYSIGHSEKVLVMLALTSCDAANGGLWYVKGSHRYGYLSNRGTVDLSKFPHLKAEGPTLEPGDVLVAHNYTWHYSEPAREPRPRVMFNVFYQPATDGNHVSMRGEPPILVAGHMAHGPLLGLQGNGRSVHQLM